MEPKDAPGWFGKLSSLGDFATRRLPDDWVQACDAWLSQSIAASREQLGERWLEVYLSAPLWRFAWAPGVIGRDWWFGVLMASCDNVGRYYPLVVAQRRDRPPLDRIAFDHLELWWMQVAQAAMHTLADPSSLETFEQALLQTPPWPGAGAVMVPQQRAAGGRERYAIAPGASLGQMLHGFAVSELHGKLTGSSLWWPLHDGGRESSFSVVAGLPAPTQFVELLGGQW